MRGMGITIDDILDEGNLASAYSLLTEQTTARLPCPYRCVELPSALERRDGTASS